MKQLFDIKFNVKHLLSTAICLSLLAFVGDAMAAGQTLGGMASTITSSFENITKLITAGSYLAGLGFAIGAIMKFKQHKDNPTQITIGQPIGLLVVAIALLFLPSVLSVAGSTMFGSSGGQTAGATGSVYTGS